MRYSFILLILASVTTKASTSIISEKNTENHILKVINNTTTKTKVYLISSSSQYNENVIGEIRENFNQQDYIIDTTYLDQHPTAIHNCINNDIKWPSIHGILASHNKEMHELNKEKISMYNSINEVFQTTSLISLSRFHALRDA